MGEGSKHVPSWSVNYPDFSRTLSRCSFCSLLFFCILSPNCIHRPLLSLLRMYGLKQYLRSYSFLTDLYNVNLFNNSLCFSRLPKLQQDKPEIRTDVNVVGECGLTWFMLRITLFGIRRGKRKRNKEFLAPFVISLPKRRSVLLWQTRMNFVLSNIKN